MDSTEIILNIEKVVRGFRARSVSAEYPDEVVVDVDREFFKGACIALHKALRSPAMGLFALDERARAGVYAIKCVFLDSSEGRWVTVSSDIPESAPYFDSMAKEMYSANLFEREIRESFGIEPIGNPDARRLRLHDEVWPEGAYPLRKDFARTSSAGSGSYRFDRVDGEGIFEVPVGPVHAGIIGPGHFRFSVAGEPIINLETRLGFTHRGAEKVFEGMVCADAVRLAECVSGDSAFSHSLAFTRAAEKIFRVRVPERVACIRAVLLELERMYNHVNDIGGMALDVGFSFPAAYASVIKEAILRLNEKISGSRYLKGANGIGSVSASAAGVSYIPDCSGAVKGMARDFAGLVKMLNSSVSFMDRVDTTGVLRRKTAEDLGAMGLCARASGIPTDLRSFSPEYSRRGFLPAFEETGDVLARLKIRIAEFEESCRMIGLLAADISSSDSAAAPDPKSAAGEAIGYSEGWRGPVLYWLRTDPDGRIDRCKIVDPSFHNWQGLSYAVLGNIIPDFPLCNKSFDLSYSGNDL